jgi:hypothetical protein
MDLWVGDVVTQCRGCGGSVWDMVALCVMWWLSVGDVVAQCRGCDGPGGCGSSVQRMCWLSVGDVMALWVMWWLSE